MNQIQVCLVGDSKTGKSTYLYHLLHNKFQYEYQPTIGVDFNTIYREDNEIWKFWDTSGNSRFSSITTSYFKSKKLFLLFFDLNNYNSFHSTTNWITNINSFCNLKDYKIILVGNKNDLNPAVTDLDINTVCNKFSLRYVSISIKNRINITELENIIKSNLSLPINNINVKNNDYVRLLDNDDNLKSKCCQCVIL